MAEKAFIEARQDRYREAHNSLDAERFLELFTEDVDYSDHSLGAIGLKKDAVRELAATVFASCKELVFTTVSLHGDLEFTAWEWKAAGEISKEIPGFPKKVGDTFTMVGCSLFWWVGTGDDVKNWKIKKEVEYSKMSA